MTLKDDIIDDLGEVHFNADDFAVTVTHNTTDKAAIIMSRGTQEDSNSIYDFVETCFQQSDISSLSYSSDTLTYDSLVWKYPKIVNEYQFVVVVRWIRNQRPRIR